MANDPATLSISSGKLAGGDAYTIAVPETVAVVNGHIPTATTRLIWRLDEATGSEPAADAVGPYTLSTISGTPVVAPGKHGSSRLFNNVSTIKGSADAATINYVASGNWTLGFWLNSTSDGGVGLSGDILALGDGGANAVFHIKINLGNGLYLGSTDKGNAGGFLVTQGVWHFIVVKRPNTGFPTRYWVSIDGAPFSMVGSDATSALTIASPVWTLGGGPHGFLRGYLDEVWFEDRVYTDAEILALYNAENAADVPTSPTVLDTSKYADLFTSSFVLQGPILDANTVGLWSLGEASGTAVADLAGHYPLTASGSPPIVAGQIGLARQFTSTATVINGPADAAAENVTKAAYTLEFWIRLDSLPTIAGVIVHLIRTFLSEWLQLVVNLDGTLVYQWRNGATSLQASTSVALPLGTWGLCGFRQVSVGGGLFNIEFWYNGQFVETISTSKLPANTITGSTKWGFGRYNDTPANYAPITLQWVRFSNVARSTAEMFETYTRGTGNAFWSIATSGGGTVSASAGLILSAPASGAIAAIRSVTEYLNFDTAISFSNTFRWTTKRPSAAATICYLKLRLSNATYAQISEKWDPTLGLSIIAEVVSNGLVVASAKLSTESTVHSLRLIRHSGSVQMWVDNTKLLQMTGWTPALGRIEIGAGSSGTAVSTLVSRFAPTALVTFDQAISDNIVEYSPFRLTGVTPKAILPGATTPLIHTIANGSIPFVKQFTYVAPDQLTVSEDGTAVVSNDDTLRD